MIFASFVVSFSVFSLHIHTAFFFPEPLESNLKPLCPSPLNNPLFYITAIPWSEGGNLTDTYNGVPIQIPTAAPIICTVSPPRSNPASYVASQAVVVSLKFPFVWNSPQGFLCLPRVRPWHIKRVQASYFVESPSTRSLSDVSSQLDFKVSIFGRNT